MLIHPWESGRDNAVEWDGPLWRVLPEVMVVRRRDTDSVDAAERPGHEHYRRFLTLVRQGTAAGWDQRELARTGRFRVLDAGFSAILARACLDLADMAERLGEPRVAEESRSMGERVAAALRARAGSDGLIGARGRRRRSPLPVTSAGSALAAAGARAGRQADRRCAASPGARAARWRRNTACARSTVRTRSARRATTGAAPCGRTSPGWPRSGSSATATERAARTLVERMLRAIDGGGMREYFSPESGRGLGARDFTWTAALCLRARART